MFPVDSVLQLHVSILLLIYAVLQFISLCMQLLVKGRVEVLHLLHHNKQDGLL